MTPSERLPREVRVLTTDGRAVCERCEVAGSFWKRAVGLMGRATLAPGAGLLLVPYPGGALHMWRMKFSIDALFLTREGIVTDFVADLAPGKFYSPTPAHGKPFAALELPHGTVALFGLQRGETLFLETQKSAN
jgi:uncharacterized membrane protein (UPF0127 family)